MYNENRKNYLELNTLTHRISFVDLNESDIFRGNALYFFLLLLYTILGIFALHYCDTDGNFPENKWVQLLYALLPYVIS